MNSVERGRMIATQLGAKMAELEMLRSENARLRLSLTDAKAQVKKEVLALLALGVAPVRPKGFDPFVERVIHRIEIENEFKRSLLAAIEAL